MITNDLIELVGASEFKWLGRKDRAINTGGYKVIPEQIHPEIAQCLSSMSINRKFIIIGLPHKKWGQQVTLVIEGNPLESSLKAQLILKLKDVLKLYVLYRDCLMNDKADKRMLQIYKTEYREELSKLRFLEIPTADEIRDMIYRNYEIMRR